MCIVFSRLKNGFRLSTKGIFFSLIVEPYYFGFCFDGTGMAEGTNVMTCDCAYELFYLSTPPTFVVRLWKSHFFWKPQMFHRITLTEVKNLRERRPERSLVGVRTFTGGCFFRFFKRWCLKLIRCWCRFTWYVSFAMCPSYQIRFRVSVWLGWRKIKLQVNEIDRNKFARFLKKLTCVFSPSFDPTNFFSM